MLLVLSHAISLEADGKHVDFQAYIFNFMISLELLSLKLFASIIFYRIAAAKSLS